MSKNKIEQGLSFDDILLVPQFSEILPSEADLSTQLTQNIRLNIPVVSSAMDTVTEDDLAIALAREGGIGVIHRNNPIDIQAKMVRAVKRSENIIIENPRSITPDSTIEELYEKMAEYRVSGFPVVDGEGKIKGIISKRDLWMIKDSAQKVSSVMTPRERLVTAPVGTTPDEAEKILYQNRIEKLPVVDSDDKLVGLMTSADIEKRKMFQQASKDSDGHLLVGGAIGAGTDTMDRAQALIDAQADALFVDAATGHTDRLVKLLAELTSTFPDVPVVAGNVVTAQGAEDLIKAGAAALKIGVGPGSICTTRVIAGVGVPQFTAVQNVSEVCRKKGIPCIADGGLRYSGDLVKALAGGADCVMLGSLLAGTEESPGAKVRAQGRFFKEYRGMGSIKAMKKGSSDRYGQKGQGKLVAEGVEGRVPYKGMLSDVVFQLMGGVQSGMGYVGAENLAALREKARFVQITSGGLKESHPHDIVITEEPTNYSVS